MGRFACFFVCLLLPSPSICAAQGLAITSDNRRVLVNDHDHTFFEFIHTPTPDVQTDEFFPSHYIHPLNGLLGEVVTGENLSLWSGAPGVHWGWSRVGIGGTLIDIENGEGGRRVFERSLGSQSEGSEGIFALQNAWLTNERNQAVAMENITVSLPPRESTLRMLDIHVLIRNISESNIRFEGALPGTGLALTLNPERVDWGFSNSTGWVKTGSAYMSPWTVGTYRDDRRSTRSGIAILQDSRNPGFSSANWLLEDGPRLTVGAPETFRTELKPAEFLEFRYRIILFRVGGGAPDMTAEFTKFMSVDSGSN